MAFGFTYLIKMVMTFSVMYDIEEMLQLKNSVRAYFFRDLPFFSELESLSINMGQNYICDQLQSFF